MNRIIIVIFIASILWPGMSFSQKREKKKKNKAETTVEIPGISEEVTNLFLDATTAKLKGDYAGAITLYKSCIEKNPKHSASMYELAQLYYTAGDFTTAATYAEQASELEPGNKWYKLLLVEIYGKADRKKELLKTCENLVKQIPGMLISCSSFPMPT
ncbi:MAG: tetratricopeptide repeat protein [Bacteroidales bacterium]